MADASLPPADLKSTAAPMPADVPPRLQWQAMLAATVRRLEQRLESERRNTQRQVQRVERRLEESLNVPSSGGRWAELEGYVDGLAETVQELMRRAEDTGQGNSLQATRPLEEAATFCRPASQATETNLQGARVVAAAVDRSQQRQCERLRQIEQLFEEYNDRLARAELQLIQHEEAPFSTISSLQTQLADVTARMGALEVHRAQLDNADIHMRALQDQPSGSPAKALLGHTDPILLASASSPNASPVRSAGASFSSPARLLQSPSEMPTVSALQVLTARVDRVVEIVGEMDARILEATEGGPACVAELHAWTAELGARTSKLEQYQEGKGTLERDIALMCEQMSVLQAQLRDGHGSREISDAAASHTLDGKSRKQAISQLNFTCERVAELGEKVQEMGHEMGSNVDASEMQAQLDHVFERTATQPAWPHGEDSEDSLCDENLSEKDGSGGGVRCEHWQAEHGAVSFVVHNPPEKSDLVYKADGFMHWLAALWDPQRDTQEYANLQDIRHLCRRVNRLTSRMQATDQALEELFASRNLQAGLSEGEGFNDSEAFSFKGRQSCIADSVVASPGTLDKVGREVREQVGQLVARVEDMEGRLQDMTELQEVRQQISRVGEQVLRLVVRLQTVENGSQALADRHEMRTELSDLNEQFAGLESLESRVQDAECGLERMAEGFRRLCEELAGLRTRTNEAEQSRCNESDAGCESKHVDAVEGLPNLQESLKDSEIIKSLTERLQELETGMHGREHVRQSLENLTKQERVDALTARVDALTAQVELHSCFQARADALTAESDALRAELCACREESKELPGDVPEHLSRMLVVEESLTKLHEKMSTFESKEPTDNQAEHLSRLLALEGSTASLQDQIASALIELQVEVSNYSDRMLALEESKTHLHKSLASQENEHVTRLLALEERTANLHESFSSFRGPESQIDMNEHVTRLHAVEERTANLHESFARLNHHEWQSEMAAHQKRLQALEEGTANLHERLTSCRSPEEPQSKLMEHLTRLDVLESEMSEHQNRMLALENSSANMGESFANLRASGPELQEKMLEVPIRLHALEESTANLHESFASFRNQDAQGEMVEHLTRLFEKSTMDLHEKIESSRSQESDSRAVEQHTRLSALEDTQSEMVGHLSRLLALEKNTANLHEKVASLGSQESQSYAVELEGQLAKVLEEQSRLANDHVRATASAETFVKEQFAKISKEQAHLASQVKACEACVKDQLSKVCQEHGRLLSEQVSMKDQLFKVSEEHGRLLSQQHDELLASTQQETHRLHAFVQARVDSLNAENDVLRAGLSACREANEKFMDQVSEHWTRIGALEELASMMSEHHLLLTALKTSMDDMHEKVESHVSKDLPSRMLEHSTRMSTLEENFTLLHEKTLDFEYKERVDSIEEQVARLKSKDPMEDISRHANHINGLLEDARKNAAGNAVEHREQLEEITGRLRETEQCLGQMMDLEEVRQQWIHGMEASQAQLKDQICKVQESLESSVASPTQGRAAMISPEASPARSSEALTGQLARTCVKVAACHEEVKRTLAGGDVGLDRSMREGGPYLDGFAPADGLVRSTGTNQELEGQIGQLCESVTAFQSGVLSAMQGSETFAQEPSLRDRVQRLEQQVLHEPETFGNESLARESLAERFNIAGGHQAQISPGRHTVDDLLLARSAPSTARGAGVETALARSEGRLLSASLRLEAQVRSLRNTGHDAGACPDAESTQAYIERLAKDLEQATLSAARRANLETHRMEALEAVESRVTVVDDRIADICSRLDEAERGLEVSERNGTALVRRFERLESAVDAQISDLAADLVSVERAALERTRQLAAVNPHRVASQSLRPVANCAAADAVVTDPATL